MKTLELHAFLEVNEVRKPFVAHIGAPKASEDAEYSCLVHAPELFQQDKEIFGIDAEQARELAVS